MSKIEDLQNLQKEVALELSKQVKHKTCISCKDVVIAPLFPPEDVPIHPLEQETGCWNDGAVGLISAGFGSKHDTEQYFIAICDKCLDEAVKVGLVESKKEIKNSIPGIDSVTIHNRFRKNIR